MAQFTLSWDKTLLTASANSNGQRVSYRKKSVGGAFSTAGFSPVNDLDLTVDNVTSPVVDNNCIYEFKVENLCDSGGPTPNSNGIIEQIGFSCIAPTIVKTSNSINAIVNVADTDITKVRFTLRKSSDNSIVYGPITVNRVGAGATVAAIAPGLSASTSYYWQIILFSTVNGVEVNSSMPAYINDVCGPTVVITDAPPVADLIWLKNSSVCETEGGFAVSKTIAGLSSPVSTFYDVPTSRIYVADMDNPNGNVYWFNPNTATTEADMTYSAALQQDELYMAYIDGPKRKIYFAGRNSGGLIVYDIATDTISTVAYGTNGGAFNRISLLVGDTRIYARHDLDATIAIIDRDTLTLINNKAISSIPNNARFTGGCGLNQVGSEIWVAAGSGSSVGTIGVYNLDLDTNITNIALPTVALWDFARYWQISFYDAIGDKYYTCDIGSNRRYVIDVPTKTVVDNKLNANMVGKTHTINSWTVNPVTSELITLTSCVNGSSDPAPIQRSYIEDRTTFAYTKVFPNQYYSNLAPITGTNKVVGTNSGIAFWNTPNTNYDTDGSVIILDNSVGGDNTGMEIVLTLKEVDHNNGDLPTGNTKANTLSDPDYIAPISNPTTCTVSYSTDCPDKVTTFSGATLEYEFSIPNSVKNNPAIAKIQVYAYNTNTASTEGAPVEIVGPFTTNYYSGSFGSLGGLNYTIKVKYLNSSNIEIQTC